MVSQLQAPWALLDGLSRFFATCFTLSHTHTRNAETTVSRIDNALLPDGGPRLQAAIANAARDAMEAWTGLPRSPSSVYCIRVYHNTSILMPHCDRLPLMSSTIINDEPWLLEVYDHDGIAHNVIMDPGDMVLYESHSVIHDRPFPMRGKYCELRIWKPSTGLCSILF